MTIAGIHDGQRRAAKLAGFAGLLPIPFLLYANFGIHEQLIVKGDAARTAENIIAHETLFRIGIACDLIYTVGVIVSLSALYVVLKPVDRTLALLATFWRLVYALMWVGMTLNLLDALRFLSGADYLRGFERERLQALTTLSLSASLDGYYIGLLFWALAATLGSYLFFKSTYIPRTLATFGMVASGWCALCTLAFIIFPSFADVVNLWWFDSPMALFEMAASFWLLFKGLGPRIMSNDR